MWKKQAVENGTTINFLGVGHESLSVFQRSVPWPAQVHIVKSGGTYIALEVQPGGEPHQISLETGGMTPDIQAELDNLNARPARVKGSAK